MSLNSQVFLVSGCLLGISCRYDGGDAGCSDIINMASSFSILPFCPEQLGGLPTPRAPARIVGGDGRDLLAGNAKVINSLGEDVTAAFMKGAEESLKLARLTKAKIALLKKKSPSCGLSTPYCDGTDESKIGVTAALFNASGIKTLEIDKKDEFPTPEFTMLFKEVYGEAPAWRTVTA